MLCWGYRFWFLPIFGAVSVYERHFWIHQLLFFWCCTPSTGWYVKMQNHILVKTVWMYQMESYFTIFLKRFWLFYAFLVRLTACTSHIKRFPWRQEPKWLQWPQKPQLPLQVYFIKRPLFQRKIYILMVSTFYYMKEAPKSQNN